MKKAVLLGLFALMMAMVATGFVFAQGEKAKSDAETIKGSGNILYVCNCGGDCKCKNGVSTKPGKCGCGGDLVPMHALKIEKDEALVCQCGKGCSCKFDPANPTKCGCGKPVKRVSIKGLYACACGVGCCATISDKPGKCGCGADLKKIE